MYSFHSIATLVFHMNYYVSATIKVLRGGPLDAKDELSFDCPPLSSLDDWERLLNKTWSEAEELASLIEQMPDSQLSETFVDEKHGTYYRCLQGPVEHCYYHLGQIAIIKSIRFGDIRDETWLLVTGEISKPVIQPNKMLSPMASRIPARATMPV